MTQHPETGPEHYAEAQRLLMYAQCILDTEPVGPRSEFEREDDFFAAIEASHEEHDSAERTAVVYSGLAQVHATLALAYATAMQPGIRNGWVPGFDAYAQQRQAHRIKGCCNGDGGPNCQPPAIPEQWDGES